MTKVKTVFYCQNCGAQSPKWIGHCVSCNEWNTYVEEVVKKNNSGQNIQKAYSFTKSKPLPITDIELFEHHRTDACDMELNRVLGGGIVPGSLVLIGGEPGIGKSTLLLQSALNMKNTKILYVSGEESSQQIRMRAERIGIKNNNCFIHTETNTAEILQQVENIKPSLVIIDSIQTLQSDNIDSSAGSVSQIRECTAEFQRYSKQTAIPFFLIGHITKDGAIAGPKILEHMVDTVLQFEGERNHIFRILRAVKNRFGSTSELGIYEMQNAGLREVNNPSEILLSHRDEENSGIAIASTIEGLRPMLIEVQALVSSAAYGTPQRSATGFDLRRMNMLLAVLEKRCGFKLGSKDVFLNMAGGIRVEDPATDLAVVLAILSSGEDIPLDRKTCFAAEIGLSGEIRPIGRIEQRISEAAKLGFENIIVSKYNIKGLDKQKFSININSAARIEEVFRMVFG